MARTKQRARKRTGQLPPQARDSPALKKRRVGRTLADVAGDFSSADELYIPDQVNSIAEKTLPIMQPHTEQTRSPSGASRPPSPEKTIVSGEEAEAIDPKVKVEISPDTKLSNRFFRFENVHADDFTINVSRVTTYNELFVHALCNGIATPATTVLEVDVLGEKVYVARDSEVYFKRLMNKIGVAEARPGQQKMIFSVRAVDWV